MKVAYVVARYPVPSETFVAREVMALKGLNLDVTVFAFKRPSREELSKLPAPILEAIEDVVYVSPVSWRDVARLWRQALRLFYVVNVRSANEGWPVRLLRVFRALKLAERLKGRGFTNLHAHWPYASIVCAFVNDVAEEPMRFTMSVHAHEVAHENNHFEFVLPLVSGVSFCNNAALSYLSDKFQRRYDSKFMLNYHGVNLDHFMVKEGQDRKLSGAIRLISVGRATKSKGFQALISGVEYCTKKGIPVTLDIVGDGALLPSLKHLVAERKLQDVVSFLGWINFSDMPELYCRYDAFALLAEPDFNDGLPNVVLEAMASGLPAILSPLPAAAEVVINETNGVILQSTEDSLGLINALKWISETRCEPGFKITVRNSIVKKFDEGSQIREFQKFLSEDCHYHA